MVTNKIGLVRFSPYPAPPPPPIGRRWTAKWQMCLRRYLIDWLYSKKTQKSSFRVQMKYYLSTVKVTFDKSKSQLFNCVFVCRELDTNKSNILLIRSRVIYEQIKANQRGMTIVSDIFLLVTDELMHRGQAGKVLSCKSDSSHHTRSTSNSYHKQ